MARAKCGGKLHPLPFKAFGEIAALSLKAKIYCSRCYEHRLIDPPSISATAVSRRLDSAAPRTGTLATSAAVRGQSRSSHPCCCQSAAKTHWPSNSRPLPSEGSALSNSAGGGAG
jgi:hypothetical protein